MSDDNNLTLNEASIPSRILYTMVRVSDLELSIEFYKNVLGMKELRRESFTEGRFTLVFIGFGDESKNAVIELTYNWDKNRYEHGTSFGHVALAVNDIYAAVQRMKSLGVNVVREPGPMNHVADETGQREVIAFIKDPDGYSIELIEHKSV